MFLLREMCLSFPKRPQSKALCSQQSGADVVWKPTHLSRTAEANPATHRTVSPWKVRVHLEARDGTLFGNRVFADVTSYHEVTLDEGGPGIQSLVSVDEEERTQRPHREKARRRRRLRPGWCGPRPRAAGHPCSCRGRAGLGPMAFGERSAALPTPCFRTPGPQNRGSEGPRCAAPCCSSPGTRTPLPAGGGQRQGGQAPNQHPRQKASVLLCCCHRSHCLVPKCPWKAGENGDSWAPLQGFWLPASGAGGPRICIPDGGSCGSGKRRSAGSHKWGPQHRSPRLPPVTQHSLLPPSPAGLPGTAAS